MSDYKYTKYFENEVIRKRPYIKKSWCIETIEDPEKIEQQEDKVTIHNAFHDRRFSL